jgi:hypothetical protein
MFLCKGIFRTKLAMAQEALTSELQNYELFGKERVSERVAPDGIQSGGTM